MTLISITNPSVDFAELSLVCQPQDSILLRQDAVYLCTRTDINWPTAKLYALDVDVQVRKLSALPAFSVIKAERWVELCVAAKVNVLWQS